MQQNNGERIKIASYKKTKEIIDKYEFMFKKKFGQNFLIDEHVLNKIIESSEITKQDIIIEIGPGIGSLTEALSEVAYKVIAVEIDKNLLPILNETLSHCDNVEIINENILKTDINKIIETYSDKNIKVVANLPYNITTPIVMKLLEGNHKIKSITVMVQKEVADRMKAKPATKDYGALSLAIQFYSEPYIVANVPRNCFMPRPNIDSAVIRLTILENHSVQVSDWTFMFKLIKLSFGQRRKTLVNCIFNQSDLGYTKEELAVIIQSAGFLPNVRGETLSLEDFAKLTEQFIENNK